MKAAHVTPPNIHVLVTILDTQGNLDIERTKSHSYRTYAVGGLSLRQPLAQRAPPLGNRGTLYSISPKEAATQLALSEDTIGAVVRSGSDRRLSKDAFGAWADTPLP